MFNPSVAKGYSLRQVEQLTHGFVLLSRKAELAPPSKTRRPPLQK